MYRTSKYSLRLLPAVLLLVAAVARAEQEKVFTEGRAGGGELRYINDLPVLIVAGTPEEMGRQKAALLGEVVKKVADYPRQLIGHSGQERMPKYIEMSRAIAQQLLPEHRDELRVFAEQAGVDRDLGLLANMLADVYRNISCSALIVEPEKSATGSPIFGRNLDFPTLRILDKYSLVTVQRPKGRHAFVSIAFPGLFGCLTGMNDAGLCLAVHEVFLARDGAPIFNPKGMPYAFCFRQILEQCTTIEEAEKMLRATERTTILSLSVCDRKKAVVLEMTPNTVAARHGSDGILACTNHFRTDELAVLPWFRICNRYPKLAQSRDIEKLDVAAVAKKMDDVNMGRMTVQTMIFEPESLRLHLAIGACPSSALPMKVLDLKPLFSDH